MRFSHALRRSRAADTTSAPFEVNTPDCSPISIVVSCRRTSPRSTASSRPCIDEYARSPAFARIAWYSAKIACAASRCTPPSSFAIACSSGYVVKPGPLDEALPVLEQRVEGAGALAPDVAQDLERGLVVRAADRDGDEREVVGGRQLVVEQRERLLALPAARVADDVLLQRVARGLADPGERLVVVGLQAPALRQRALFEQAHEIDVARAERDQREPHLRPRLDISVGAAMQHGERADEALVAVLALRVGGDDRLAQALALARAEALHDLVEAEGLELEADVDGAVVARPDRDRQLLDELVETADLGLGRLRARGDGASERAPERDRRRAAVAAGAAATRPRSRRHAVAGAAAVVRRDVVSGAFGPSGLASFVDCSPGASTDVPFRERP